MGEVSEITASELKRRLEDGEQPNVLDVRESEEILLAPFLGAIHISMGEVPSRLTELDPDAEWIILCHHGIRSAQVAMYLVRNGFEKVANLTGGIDQWSLTVDPSTPRY